MSVNALFTAVSGLNANQTYLGVIGNNIANSNTDGFKSSDPIFENLVSQTMSGTSSSQEGLGTSVYSIQQEFGQGALQTTSNPLDMAIDGNGFFIVKAPNGSTFYTRNGQFSENAKGNIVDPTGNVVQGYPLSSSGVASSGSPQDISLNTGAIAPKATATATLTANLDSNIQPQIATNTSSTSTFAGSFLTAPAVKGSDTIVVKSATGFSSSSGAAGNSILIGNGDGSNNAYTIKSITGNTITLNQPLSSSVLQNTAVSQSTINLASTASIDSGNSIQINTTGKTTSATSPDPYQFLDTVASVVTPSTSSTAGTVALENAMPLTSAGYTAGGAVLVGPPSDYYSTTINTYDSLGNALPLTVTFAPSSSTSGSWNAYYSFNGTAAERQSLTSTAPDVTFNSSGQILTGQSLTLTDVPPYVGTSTTSTLPDGAKSPLTIALNLNNLTQYAAPSATTSFIQDGYSTGTLTSFTVDKSGRITGLFSNGQTKYLYQVALANFVAPTGLVSEGNSLYSQSYASGQPAVGTAQTGNFGYITDSALEQSNVNISSQFTNMIIAQNAYVANSKVLTTENAMLTSLEQAVA
jgi:flagellar hook protein FlgE